MEQRNLKIIKNPDGHGTMGYKIALPSKWIKSMGLDKQDYATLIFKDNGILIKNMEVLKMEEMLKELKEELLNKEMSLLEMDNKIESITGSTTSLFDYPDEIENESASYYIAEDAEIVVDYNIIEKNDDKLEIKIKVIDIWEN